MFVGDDDDLDASPPLNIWPALGMHLYKYLGRKFVGAIGLKIHLVHRFKKNLGKGLPASPGRGELRRVQVQWMGGTGT